MSNWLPNRAPSVSLKSIDWHCCDFHLWCAYILHQFKKKEDSNGKTWNRSYTLVTQERSMSLVAWGTLPKRTRMCIFACNYGKDARVCTWIAMQSERPTRRPLSVCTHGQTESMCELGCGLLLFWQSVPSWTHSCGRTSARIQSVFLAFNTKATEKCIQKSPVFLFPKPWLVSLFWNVQFQTREIILSDVHSHRKICACLIQVLKFNKCQWHRFWDKKFAIFSLELLLDWPWQHWSLESRILFEIQTSIWCSPSMAWQWPVRSAINSWLWRSLPLQMSQSGCQVAPKTHGLNLLRAMFMVLPMKVSR